MKIFSLASSVFIAATAATPVPAEAPEAEPRDTPVEVPSKPTSIPFELRDNLVTFEVAINGRRQRAVLDSGAGGLVIDRDFAGTIGLREGDSVGNVAAAGDQAEQLRPVDVKSLIVGPLRFAHIPAYSVNLGQLSSSAGFPVKLIVGAPAFKHGAVTVDYGRHRVTFGPSGSGRACAAPIPLSIVNDVPVVEVSLRPTPHSEPIRLKLAVDLGTRHNAMMIGGPFVRSDAGMTLMRSGKAQKVGHGIGGEVQGSLVRVAEMRVGALKATEFEVALSSGAAAFEAGFIDGSLGVPFWKTGVITFDYPAKTLCIEK